MRHSYEIGRSIYILLGASVAAISLGLVAPPASAKDVATVTAISAARPATTEPSNTKRPASNDKTPDISADRYFIEFRSRAAANYGHMYVLYGQVNARGEIVASEIAGLHPAGDANNCENCSVVNWTLGHVVFVPSETGASDGDLEEKYVTGRYRVMLDEARYNNVAAYIKKLQADSPLWHAVLKNCVSFGRDIAKFMGLRVTSTSWMEPKAFVDDLRELNGGEKQERLVDAPNSVEASVPLPSHSVKLEKSSARQKPKNRPVTNLPRSRAAGLASGTPR